MTDADINWHPWPDDREDTPNIAAETNGLRLEVDFEPDEVLADYVWSVTAEMGHVAGGRCHDQHDAVQAAETAAWWHAFWRHWRHREPLEDRTMSSELNVEQRIAQIEAAGFVIEHEWDDTFNVYNPEGGLVAMRCDTAQEALEQAEAAHSADRSLLRSHPDVEFVPATGQDHTHLTWRQVGVDQGYVVVQTTDEAIIIEVYNNDDVLLTTRTETYEQLVADAIREGDEHPFEVQGHGPGVGNWSPDYAGTETSFTTVAAAKEAIKSLHALGDEWAKTIFRIVDIQSQEVLGVYLPEGY